MTIHKGNLIVFPGDTTDYSALTAVEGCIEVQEGAKFTAPSLESAGLVVVYAGGTMDAPAIESADRVFVYKGATLDAPSLTEVKGWINVHEFGTMDAPNLKR